jgi:hypothetical protein
MNDRQQAGFMISPGKCTSNDQDSDTTVTPELTLVQRARSGRSGVRTTQAATYACLVVSPDPLRQMMFGQTAQRTGWRPIVCGDFDVALDHITSSEIGAALVDIATPADHAVPNMRRLVERLAENKDVLTVVCGRTNDRLAEIWARELGVWAHLPGVAPESDLDSLLRAARQVVERMHARRDPSRTAEQQEHFSAE